MKSKILKTMVVILILVSLTLVNFVYVGAGIVSYAASENETNHKNVEFTANLKDEKTLSLEIGVKNEGYFNGEINLKDSNFKLKNSNSGYVNKLEENKIVLNQLNAGTKAQIDVEIEPLKDEIFDVNLLTTKTKVELVGTYKDSTEKNINIEATKEVNLQYTYNKENNVENSAEVVTKKVLNINGEDKKVVQLSLNMGLKDNQYPIKEMSAEVNLPDIEGTDVEIKTKANFNTSTRFEWNYKYDKKAMLKLNFTNKPSEDNKIVWKKQGTENVIVTLIYSKDAKIEDSQISIKTNVTLYDDNTLSAENNVVIGEEEKEALVQMNVVSQENNIYKGKLNSNIERSFETKTIAAINLANVGDGLNIKEEAATYKTNDDKEIAANVIFNKTVISKANFDEILGQTGTIKILNQKGEVITTITNSTTMDNNGNIVVEYGDSDVTALEIQTSIPVKEGDLKFTHTKTIKPEKSSVLEKITELNSKVVANYGTDTNLSNDLKIALQNSTTEAVLEVNRETLSTVVDNDIEIRATLKSNNEKYNLYENPRLTFELPETVENIEVKGIDLVYESEMKIKNYTVNGRNIVVELEGKQTQYKDAGIEGTILIVNAKLKLNRKAATQDSKITMTCVNRKETLTQEKAVKVVAPTDITAIHNIAGLGIETIGQDEYVNAKLERGQKAKTLQTDIEVINNNENMVQNVKVLGTFPTKNNTNNIDINIVEGINISNVEGAKVYYTDNENANDNVQDANNKWTENIEDGKIVKKFLIYIPNMAAGTSVIANYKMQLPAGLEYNQQAKQGYVVNYENAVTKAAGQVKTTEIIMQTGVGPKLETKLSASLAGKELTDTSTVKNGEVIKYKVEVSNVGSEDIAEATIQGTVPEGTVLVEPEPNYEYTGSSYYKELDSKVYETKINNLKAGSVTSKEYEVRVKSDTKAGTKLVAKNTLKYGDVIKESNEVSNITETGKLRVTVKRVTDRSIDLYETGVVQYYAIIENISNEKQDNVKVKTHLENALEVERLTLITNLPSEEVNDGDIIRTDEDYEKIEKAIKEGTYKEPEIGETTDNKKIQTEQIEYKNELNIGTIEPGENKVLNYDMKIDKLKDTDILKFSVSANSEGQDYNSNVVEDTVKKADLSMTMTANTQSQYVKAGDEIEYTINIKNNGKHDLEGLTLKDSLPKALTVNKVLIEGKEEPQLAGRNDIELRIDMSSNAEMTIKIQTVVNYSEGRVEAEPISNSAYIELLAEKVAQTSEINHIIEANDSGDNGNNNGDNNGNNGEDNQNGDIANGKMLVTGVAWFDENANGQKDDNEKLLPGIKVKLYNAETNNTVKDKDGKVLEATTNDKGVYILNNIPKGKYIVMFDYNTSEYSLTKYRVSGVGQDKNSSAMMKELTIEGNKQNVASTDIIEVSDKNIPDINIGLIKLQNFDLKLEKFVSKIIVQDSTGTTVKEYGDATLAKAELDRKKINGATVLVEYKIRVSNVGEVDGYVRKIADYMPNDLKFSSELNKDWYQTSEGLYNSSLANEKITAGESKEITLTLTKSMTENNVGRINNSAEIAEAYNDLGLADSNSTPGNKAQEENDYGSADIILSIKTGGMTYVGITAGIVILLAAVAFVIIKINKNKKEEEI